MSDQEALDRLRVALERATAVQKHNVQAQVRVDDLRALLAAEQSGGWRTMETAPRDGTRILAYCPNHPDRGPLWRVTWWRRDIDNAGFIGWGEFNMSYWPPTHWQPLLEPALYQILHTEQDADVAAEEQVRSHSDGEPLPS